MKILKYKSKDITIQLMKQSLISSIIKDSFTYGLVLILQIINYKFLGNGLFINLVFFIVFICFVLKHTSVELTKDELLKIINKE